MQMVGQQPPQYPPNGQNLDNQIRDIYKDGQQDLNPNRYKGMGKPHLEAELKQRDTLILDLRDTVEVKFSFLAQKLIDFLDS